MIGEFLAETSPEGEQKDTFTYDEAVNFLQWLTDSQN